MGKPRAVHFAKANETAKPLCAQSDAFASGPIRITREYKDVTCVKCLNMLKNKTLM